ncbi:MAG: SpoIID/LytB domain-containing protein [Waddliaceae bacterium]
MIVMRVLMLLLVLAPLSTPPLEGGFWEKLKEMIWNKSVNPPPTIEVLIVNDQPSAMLDVTGKYRIFDPHAQQSISKRFLGKRKSIQSLSSGLKWGEEFPGVYQIHIVPEDPSQVTFIDGVEYKGSFFIYDIGGTISIVNQVNIEDYLKSTLPKEFPIPMPEETLAAIAIAARTNAFYYSQHPSNRFWAVDAKNVGYQGVELTSPMNDMERAIQMTRYMVLSQTGAYEGVVTPFASRWGSVIGSHSAQQIESHISLHEAEQMGKNNKHAAQILSHAFPDSHIEMIY